MEIVCISHWVITTVAKHIDMTVFVLVICYFILKNGSKSHTSLYVFVVGIRPRIQVNINTITSFIITEFHPFSVKIQRHSKILTN